MRVRENRRAHLQTLLGHPVARNAGYWQSLTPSLTTRRSPSRAQNPNLRVMNQSHRLQPLSRCLPIETNLASTMTRPLRLPIRVSSFRCDALAGVSRPLFVVHPQVAPVDAWTLPPAAVITCTSAAGPKAYSLPRRQERCAGSSMPSGFVPPHGADSSNDDFGCRSGHSHRT